MMKTIKIDNTLFIKQVGLLREECKLCIGLGIIDLYEYNNIPKNRKIYLEKRDIELHYCTCSIGRELIMNPLFNNRTWAKHLELVYQRYLNIHIMNDHH